MDFIAEPATKNPLFDIRHCERLSDYMVICEVAGAPVPIPKTVSPLLGRHSTRKQENL